MRTTASSPNERDSKLLISVASFFATVLAIACLYWGRAVLIPVALALLLTFLLAPVVDWLQRKGRNRIQSVLIVVALTGIGFVVIGWVVVSQVAGLARDLRRDEYKANIQKKIENLRGVGKGGFLDDMQATIIQITGEFESAEESVDGSTKPGSSPSPPASEIGSDIKAAINTNTPSPVVVQAKDASPFPRLQAALTPLMELIASVGLVIVLVIFMLLKHEDLRNRLVSLFGEGQLTQTTKALADAGQRISRYLVMQLFINGTYGIAVGLGLLLIGVPYAFLWGFLAALLRYVPYVGPWIAAVFPVVTSLVAFTTWWPVVLVLALILVCELISNMVVEPMLYGQSIGVSEVALLVATGFWTWLWGPIGLVLATPLTVCLIVLGRHVPALRIIALLIGDKPPLESHAAFYQRLLANDKDEALEVTQKYAVDHGAEQVYDDVLIPALLLARTDRKIGSLSREDEDFAIESTREILDKINSTQGKDRAVSPSAVGKGDSADGQFPMNGTESQPPISIIACPAHQEAEEVILHMLRHLLRPSGYEVEVIPRQTLASELLGRVLEVNPAVVFIAVLPGGLPQARFLCNQLRKELPQQHIVVGYWGRKEEYDKVLVRLRQAGASYLTTSILQARARIVSLAKAANPDVGIPHGYPEGTDRYLA